MVQDAGQEVPRSSRSSGSQILSALKTVFKSSTYSVSNDSLRKKSKGQPGLREPEPSPPGACNGRRRTVPSLDGSYTSTPGSFDGTLSAARNSVDVPRLSDSLRMHSFGCAVGTPHSDGSGPILTVSSDAAPPSSSSAPPYTPASYDSPKIARGAVLQPTESSTVSGTPAGPATPTPGQKTSSGSHTGAVDACCTTDLPPRAQQPSHLNKSTEKKQSERLLEAPAFSSASSSRHIVSLATCDAAAVPPPDAGAPNGDAHSHSLPCSGGLPSDKVEYERVMSGAELSAEAVSAAVQRLQLRQQQERAAARLVRLPPAVAAATSAAYTTFHLRQQRYTNPHFLPSHPPASGTSLSAQLQEGAMGFSPGHEAQPHAPPSAHPGPTEEDAHRAAPGSPGSPGRSVHRLLTVARSMSVGQGFGSGARSPTGRPSPLSGEGRRLPTSGQQRSVGSGEHRRVDIAAAGSVGSRRYGGLDSCEVLVHEPAEARPVPPCEELSDIDDDTEGWLHVQGLTATSLAGDGSCVRGREAGKAGARNVRAQSSILRPGQRRAEEDALWTGVDAIGEIVRSERVLDGRASLSFTEGAQKSGVQERLQRLVQGHDNDTCSYLQHLLLPDAPSTASAELSYSGAYCSAQPSLAAANCSNGGAPSRSGAALRHLGSSHSARVLAGALEGSSGDSDGSGNGGGGGSARAAGAGRRIARTGSFYRATSVSGLHVGMGVSGGFNGAADWAAAAAGYNRTGSGLQGASPSPFQTSVGMQLHDPLPAASASRPSSGTHSVSGMCGLSTSGAVGVAGRRALAIQAGLIRSGTADLAGELGEVSGLGSPRTPAPEPHEGRSAEELVQQLRDLYGSGALGSSGGSGAYSSRQGSRGSVSSGRQDSLGLPEVPEAGLGSGFEGVGVVEAAALRAELVEAMWKRVLAKDTDAVSYLLGLDPAARCNRRFARVLQEMRTWVYVNMW